MRSAAVGMAGRGDLVAVGLVIGIGSDPTPAEFEELLDRGLIPESGFQFVALALSPEEASDRSILRSHYILACNEQGWLDGMQHADTLTFRDVVVAGTPMVIVQPQGVEEPGSAGGADGPPGRPSPEDAAARIVVAGMLDGADATALTGCTRIVAVAILHDLPHLTGHTANHIAGLFVEQDKGLGWIPDALTVEPDTPVRMVHRPDASLLQTSETNAILAQTLVELAPDPDLRDCSAIGISGDNPALGHTTFAVLAARPATGEAPHGGEEPDAAPPRKWSLRRRRS
jgi:hypothetical protein